MNIYILTDGVSEDFTKKTTLEITDHPNLDRVASLGTLGLYEPARRIFVPNPETYVVFPYFFGLNPKNNPGRAGLELLGEGIDIRKFPNCAIYRILPKEYDVRKGWDKAPLVRNESKVLEIVEMLKMEFADNTKTIKSGISKKGNVWCLCSNGRESLDDYLSTLQFEVSKQGLNAYFTLFQDFIPSKRYNSRTNDILYGWTIGSLLEGFKLAGVKIEQPDDINENHLFNYSMKLEDVLNRIVPLMEKQLGSDSSGIIYFKESSSASRKKTREDKIIAINYIDIILGEILNKFNGEDINLVVLGDHQSNIGIERTFQGPTIYSYCNLQSKLIRLIRQISFDERKAFEISSVIEQSELIKKINRFVKYQSQQIKRSDLKI